MHPGSGVEVGGGTRGPNCPLWLDGLKPSHLEAGPLLEQVNTLHAQALTNARIAHGITFSFAELARVPATAKAIQCLPLRPGTVAQHLGRFPQLERVDQVIAGSLAKRTRLGPLMHGA